MALTQGNHMTNIWFECKSWQMGKWTLFQTRKRMAVNTCERLHHLKEPKQQDKAQCFWHIPPNQLEPMKAVVERVVSRQSAFPVLQATRGHFSCTVVHLPHLVQPLPVGADREQVWEVRRGSTLALERQRHSGGRKWGTLLEFLQGPVVGGAVLQILNLHGHHSAGERPWVSLLLRLRRQQLGRQWRVQGVGEQHELELNLKRSNMVNKTVLTQTMMTQALPPFFKAATFPSRALIHHGYIVSFEVLMSRLGLGVKHIHPLLFLRCIILSFSRGKATSSLNNVGHKLQNKTSEIY